MKRLAQILLAGLCLAVAGCSTSTRSQAHFQKIIDRPRVPLSATVEVVPNTNALVQLRFTYATEAGQRVPGYLLKRADVAGPRPVVIALHGTGGSKANMLAFCRKLATNGFVAVAIDGRYHGERIATGKGTESYYAAIVRAWESGDEHPLYYDTVWDIQRLLDWLSDRADVDKRRIGLFGISKGGIETYLAAAMDRRVAVAVTCLGVQSFEWALEHEAWAGRIRTIQPAFDAICQKAGTTNAGAVLVRQFYERVLPGITGAFDGPQVLPLVAPRPLLVISSDSDANTPLPGVLLSTDAARAAYRELGAEERFKLRIQERTGHQLKPESERAAIDWLVRWLKP